MDPISLSKSYDNCCRTCLHKDSNEMYDILEENNKESINVCELLSTYTWIQVTMEDNLPKKLCKNCYRCLLSFHNFTITAIKVDIKLKEQNGQHLNPLALLQTNWDQHNLTPSPTLLSQTSPLCPLTSPLQKPSIFSSVFISSYNAENKCKTNNKDDNTCSSEEPTNKQTDQNIKYINESLEEDNNSSNSLEIPVDTGHKEYKCEICNKKFKKYINLEQHMMSHTKEYNCVLCAEAFRDHNKYIEHLIKHNNQNPVAPEADRNMNQRFVCEICSLSFKSIPSLSAHTKKHIAKDRVLQCTVCSKLFKKISHLKRHELSHIDNRLFKCTMCPKSYATEEALTAHLNKHNGIKTHCCPICMRSFGHLRALTNHIKIHTREKPYLCPTCGKVFDSSTNLNQHMKRHAGIKMFACNLCPRKFVSKGELKSHGLTHSGVRSFTCDQCSSAFPKRSSLEKHKLTHLGLKPHHCDVCVMKFSDKSHLKRHYRIHTGEKPYRCEICDRAFTQSNDLVKHKRTHLGNNLYKCVECSQSFRLKTELRQHISEHFISAQLLASKVNVNSEQSQYIQGTENLQAVQLNY